MGKCSVCGKKILYNAFKKIKGVIYCLKCVPKETVMIVNTAKLNFSEFEEAMKETVSIVNNGTEPEEILSVCKYCGCKGSSAWLELPDNEWCCKKKGCRKKFREEYEG